MSIWSRGSIVFGICLVAACSIPPTPIRTPPDGGQTSTSRPTLKLPTTYTPTPKPATLPTEPPSPKLTPLPTLPPTPSITTYDQAAALLPSYSSDPSLFPKATRYWIELNVEFDPVMSFARLKGIARIRFTNPLDAALSELVLMLWPNEDQYQAMMTAGPVLIEDQLIAPKRELEGIAIRFDLPRSLDTGKTIEISLPFEVEATSIHGAAPKRFGIIDGLLIAPTFYPLVPRIVEGEWQVEVPPPGGDTTNSDIALYTVQFTVPAGFDLVTSGVEVEREEMADGAQRVVYVSGPMRDFAFALAKFETKSWTVDDVRLQAWVLPEHVDDLNTLLDAARLQLNLLNERLGAYPYLELDLVDAPGAFGGIEYPGLVFIGTLGTSWVVEPTVHEVAHQWFYGLIGNDQLHEPWLDEAAAVYAEALYYERKSGVGQATGFLSDLRAIVRSLPDATVPIGLNVGEYASGADYGVFVYYKGALFFDALRTELGDRAFFKFLGDYFQQHRYGFATSEDFQSVAEAACDCNLQDLFDLWVYEGGETYTP